MPKVTVNDIGLYYETTGSGAGADLRIGLSNLAVAQDGAVFSRAFPGRCL